MPHPWRSTVSVILALLPACMLAACAGDEYSPAGAVHLPSLPTTPVTSLAGEILAADGASCPAQMAGWLKTADRNGDGLLDPEEAKADAARFFAAVDANGDGIVTPLELSSYRDREAPSAYADRVLRETHFVSNEEGASKKRETQSATSGFSFRAEPDPVMAADANLDFHVNAEELAAKVAERFTRLDTNHDGKLDAAELAGYCPKD